MKSALTGLRIEPDWIKHANKVCPYIAADYSPKILRFEGFFKERVTGSPTETFRVRKLIFMYYLEDGTVQINEICPTNSGIPQGPFLRRQKLSTPDGSLVKPEDLVCGRDITVYSRVIRISDMDEFTRKFLADQGVSGGQPVVIPGDHFFAARVKDEMARQQPVPEEVVMERSLTNVLFGGNEINRKTRQYLENDGKVLCFNCIWDDDSDSGYRHYLELHWFLSDDSLEIIEVHPRTDSCAAARSSFLKRGVASIPYTVSKLKLGETIEIVSRKLFLYDCDEFTRNYYADNLAIVQTKIPMEITQPRFSPVLREEDRLVPRKPRIDVAKQSLTGIVLRFQAYMQTDPDRHFIIGYYPVDDSIAVWEVPARNSGIMAGKFAERSKKVKSDGTHYTLTDFSVDNPIVMVSGCSFMVTQPDEFTRKYLME